MGLVEVKPRTGIRRLAYQFKPAVLQSLATVKRLMMILSQLSRIYGAH